MWHRVDRFASILLMTAGAGFTLAAAALLGSQVVGWLRSGVWDAWPAARVIGELSEIGWMRFARTLAFLLNQPTTLWFVVIGFALWWTGFRSSRHLAERERREREEKRLTNSKRG